MGGIFRPDGPVMVFLRKIADMLIVNFLWIVCSIPIVTIGASTTALYYVCFKIVNGDEPYVLRGFFKSFKDNFKQATLIWLFFIAAIILLIIDINVLTNMSFFDSNLGTVLFCAVVFVAAIVISMFVYAFALQSRYENSVKNTLKNAAIYGVSYYGYTIIMLLLDAGITWAGFIYFPFILPVAPICINTLLIKRIFEKTIPERRE